LSVGGGNDAMMHDAASNSGSPTSMRARAPNRSAAWPPSTIQAAETTRLALTVHCTPAELRKSSVRIVGNAAMIAVPWCRPRRPLGALTPEAIARCAQRQDGKAGYRLHPERQGGRRGLIGGSRPAQCLIDDSLPRQSLLPGQRQRAVLASSDGMAKKAKLAWPHNSLNSLFSPLYRRNQRSIGAPPVGWYSHRV
jgi:hypothetical protein